MRNGLVWIIILALVTLVAAACTTGPEVYEYPETVSERSASLPAGLTRWHILVPVGVLDVRSDQPWVVPPIPVPIVWEHGLTDRLSLTGIPIPLGASFQLIDSQQHRLAAQAGVSEIVFGGSDLVVVPSIRGNYQYSPAQWLGINAGAGVGLPVSVPEFAISPIEYELVLEATLSLQFGPKVHLSISNPIVDYPSETRSILPVSPAATVSWSINRKWDLVASTVYETLGMDDDFIILVDFIRYF